MQEGLKRLADCLKTLEQEARKEADGLHGKPYADFVEGMATGRAIAYELCAKWILGIITPAAAPAEKGA